MFRKSVAVAATAALLCGSAIALGAAEHAARQRDRPHLDVGLCRPSGAGEDGGAVNGAMN